MKHQWVIRVAGLAAFIVAGVVFARWTPDDDRVHAPEGYEGFFDPVARDHEQARALFDEGNLDEAIELARSVLRREPEWTRTWWLLGEGYIRRGAGGDLDRARSAFARADAIETVRSDHYRRAEQFHQLGVIRLRAGNDASAQEAFARSVVMQRALIERSAQRTPRDPVDPILLYNLACYEARAGEREAALASWERAVDLGYRDVGYALTDADLVSIRDDPRFIASCDRALEAATPRE